MAIGDLTSKFSHVDNNISSILEDAKSKYEDIIGDMNVNTRHGLFQTNFDFTGMSQEGMEKLKTSVATHCTKVDEIVDNLNENAVLDDALKGTKLTVACGDFVSAVKKLLKAYVSRRKIEIEEVESAWINYSQADIEAGTQTSSDAESIRNNATTINLDAEEEDVGSEDTNK